jgi:hypothetical protein
MIRLKKVIWWMVCVVGLLALENRPAAAQLWMPAKTLSADYLQWSPARRLQVRDFELRVRPRNNLSSSYASFGLEMNGRVADLLSKRANFIVQNFMHRPSSYLDSTDAQATAVQLQFLQTEWDIYEVASRRVRQQLRASARKIILWGKPDVNEVFRTACEEANKRVIQYSDETKYGLFVDKQREWEAQLARELAELADFATAK